MFMIFARKINNIPEFYVIFARILHKNCQKSIFPEFFWGVGVRAPSPHLLRLWYLHIVTGCIEQYQRTGNAV